MRWTRMALPGERRAMRTAKPCGPGTPGLVLSLQAKVCSDGDYQVTDTGESAEQAVNRRAGNAGTTAGPVVTLLVCFFHSHTRLRVPATHRAFPAPSPCRG